MDFHGTIMNIPIDNPQHDHMNDRENTAYKLGHRDARHKAAEISIEADQLIQQLGDALENAKGAFDTPVSRRRIPDDDGYIRQTRDEMNQAVEALKRFRER